MQIHEPILIMIKVLLQSRVNLFSKPGGDTRQICDLKKGLEKNGLNVGISTELEPLIKDYDVVHLFNITRVHETYLQMTNAKRQGKPVVCSTIYHALGEYNRKGRYGTGRLAFRALGNDETFEYARGLLHALKDRRQIPSVARQWITGYRSQQEKTLKGADRIIFGSLSEKETVFSHFSSISNRINYNIIKIGVSWDPRNSDGSLFEKQFGIKDFVLCVGRIEDLKNQLRLIRAMRGLSIPLVLIGSLNSGHRSYCRRVLAEVDEYRDLYFLGSMPRDMLGAAYAAAKVHILPSWFETTGLASLEAAMAGCNIVSTDRGYARDYLKDYAWYCDPSNLLSIRNAVQTAYDSPVKPGLIGYTKNEFDFQKMLERFIDLYKEIQAQN